MENTHKLIIIRTDAIVSESTFSGWFGEAAGDRYYTQMVEDRRNWEVRSRFVREVL